VRRTKRTLNRPYLLTRVGIEYYIPSKIDRYYFIINVLRSERFRTFKRKKSVSRVVWRAIRIVSEIPVDVAPFKKKIAANDRNDSTKA